MIQYYELNENINFYMVIKNKVIAFQSEHFPYLSFFEDKPNVPIEATFLLFNFNI